MRLHIRAIRSVSGLCASLLGQGSTRRQSPVRAHEVDCLEPLEPRQLLAAVSWTGGAGDNLWQSPSNWSSNAVPTIADDVTISVPASNPTILFNSATGARSVNSLTTSETIDFQGGSLGVATTADFSSNLTLSGGTLSGGSYTGSGGSRIVPSNNGGTLLNVTLNGELIFDVAGARATVAGTTTFTAARMKANSSVLFMTSGYVLQSPVTGEGVEFSPTFYVQLASDAPGTVTIAPTGSIRLPAGAIGQIRIEQSNPATLVNNGLISAESSLSVSINTSGFVNNGVAQATSGRLNVGKASTTTWNNAAGGVLSATTGAVLALDGTWTDAGSISINDATLSIGGSLHTTDFNFAGFSRVGGTVTLGAQLDNTGSTLSLNASTGSWQFAAGKIIGGALATADGANLLFTSGDGELANFAWVGDLFLDVNQRITVSGTTSFDRALLAEGARFTMIAGYVLNAPLLSTGSGATQRVIGVRTGAAPGDVTISATGSIHVDSSAGSSASTAIQLSNNCRLINGGQILIDTGTLFTSGTSGLTNSATIVTGGAFHLGPAVSATFYCNIDASSGLGDWQTGPAAIVIGSRFINTGQTLTLSNATGTWTLAGGTITGGTVSFADGKQLTLTSSGTLDSVIYNGDLILSSGLGIVLTGTTRFNSLHFQSSTAAVQFGSPSFVLQDPVIVEGASSGTRVISLVGTTTITPTGLIQVTAGCGGGLQMNVQGVSSVLVSNNGVIENLTTSQPLQFSLGTQFGLTNSGTVRTLGGTLTFSSTVKTTGASTISVPAGSTINIDSTLDCTAGLGAFTATGATVTVRGTVLNTGNALTLNAATSSWTLLGGQVLGGSLTFADGARLLITSTQGRLTNVAINGDIALDTASAKVSVEGTTTFTTLRLAQSSTQVTLGNGVVVSGAITAEGAASGTRTVSIAVSTSVTISPSGQIRQLAGSGGTLLINPSAAGTLINNGLISGELAGATLAVRMVQLTNNGTIQSIGGTLTIASTSWTNAPSAVISATNGTLTVSGTWTNSGVISIANGTANIGGTGNLGGISGTAPSNFNLAGVLSNIGNTLNWDNSMGTLTVVGNANNTGVITGGTINLTSGALLHVSGFAGKLTDVAVSGDILLDEAGSTLSLSGSTTFVTAHLASSVTLVALAGYTLKSTVLVEGAATGLRHLQYFDGVVADTTSLIRVVGTPGGGLSIESQSSGVPSFTNNGTITLDAGASQISITGTFTNNSVIQAGGGSLSISGFTNNAPGTITATNAQLTLQSGWVNTGHISVTSTTVTLGGFADSSAITGGRFVRVGGAVNLTGALSNGILQLDDQTGSLTMVGGQIQNATLRRVGSADILFSSTAGLFTNVIVEADIYLAATNAKLNLAGTTSIPAVHLTGSGATLGIAGGYSINFPVLAEGAVPGTRHVTLGIFGAGGSSSVGPSGAIRVVAGSAASLIIDNTSSTTFTNTGLISSEQPGQSLSVLVTNFNNTGTIVANGGNATIKPGGTFSNIASQALTGGTWRVINGGSITTFFTDIRTINATVELGGPTNGWNVFGKLQTVGATGSFVLSGGLSLATTPVTGTLSNNGLLTVGPGSTLAVTGKYVQAAAATLRIQLAGATPGTYGVVTTTSTATLAGTLDVVAVNGYQPQQFDVQNVLVSTGATTGTFSTVHLPPPGSDDWKILLVYTGNGVQVLTTSRADLNNDGVIDLQDFFDFLNAFDITDGLADIDGDGDVNLGDFFLFLNLFDQS